MTGRVFVDTNVFLYARDSTEPDKQRRAHGWLTFLWRHRTGRTSFQVLKEYYQVYTRKLGGDPAQAREDVRELQRWHPVVVDFRVFRGAWALEFQYCLSWWDALVASAAQVAGCDYLLTEDLQEGLKLGATQVVNPFSTSFEDLQA